MQVLWVFIKSWTICWSQNVHTSVFSRFSRTSRYSEAYSPLTIKESHSCGGWFGFALVWMCPLLLPFVFLDGRTLLLSVQRTASMIEGAVDSVVSWERRLVLNSDSQHGYWQRRGASYSVRTQEQHVPKAQRQHHSRPEENNSIYTNISLHQTPRNQK